MTSQERRPRDDQHSGSCITMIVLVAYLMEVVVAATAALYSLSFRRE